MFRLSEAPGLSLRCPRLVWVGQRSGSAALCHCLLRMQGEGNRLLLVLPESPEREGFPWSPPVPLPEAHVMFQFYSHGDFVS